LSLKYCLWNSKLGERETRKETRNESSGAEILNPTVRRANLYKKNNLEDIIFPEEDIHIL